MAYLQVSYVSQCLMRSVTLNVILPVDRFSFGKGYDSEGPYPTLYLLHGIFGNHTDWINGTRIQRWAEQKGLAVIMPDGENSFYVDRENGALYSQFVGRELVEITRKMFPLSHRREDTFIGGLSMGGYGALTNGFRYNKTFSRIIALSSALHVFEKEDLSGHHQEEIYFGNLKKASKTYMNPRVSIDRIINENSPRPEIFLACGRQDFLLPGNLVYRDLLKNKGFKVTWKCTNGGHTWDFWDKYIEEAINWLP